MLKKLFGNTAAVVLAFSFIGIIVGVVLTQYRTAVFPHANDTQPSIINDLVPSLPPPNTNQPNTFVPTPMCTTDAKECTTCCTMVNGQQVCQKACPAYKTNQIE